MEFVESALGIHDLIDLLLLIYNFSAGVNFHEVVGEQPILRPGISIVRRIEPDVVEDRDRAGHVLSRSGRFLGRLPHRHRP